MLVRGTHGEKSTPTFKLIPISLDCPFNECIYDPEKKALGIISKVSYQSIRLVPRLDANGDTMPFGPVNERKVKMERINLESFYDYELSNDIDIATFVNEMTGSTITLETILNNVVENEQTA